MMSRSRASLAGLLLSAGTIALLAFMPVPTRLELGLLAAFDCPDGKTRDGLIRALFDEHVLVLGCGTRSVRFRPPLTITSNEIEEALATLDKLVKRIPHGVRA